MFEFKMPQLGETVLEAVITRWIKQPGESVEVDESLVEVSTDKVDSEIPSPVAGTLSEIMAQEGETVLVGAVMAEIDEQGAKGSAGDGEASAATAAPAAPESVEEAPEPPPEAPVEKPEIGAPVDEEPAAVKSPAAQVTGTTDGPPGPGEPMRRVLSPLVRRLAAEHRVDLNSVTGTGAGGRITKQDVMTAVEAGAAARKAGPQVAEVEPAAAPQETAYAEAARSRPEAEETVQVSAMRRAIADHMVTSTQETARAWNTIEVNMSRIARLRDLAGASFKQAEGYSLTWMPFVCKATTQALLKFPQVNSTWNGDGTITKKRYVNLGIAVALENGLIVPVVKGAEAMNIMGLARAVRDVAQRARNRKLAPDDVQGGTFTLTNPGTFGSLMSMPIINRGQAAILSFDAVLKRPVVVSDEFGEDSIGIGHMTYLSLSWDHRIMDGAEAAKFLAYLKALLEEADFTSDLSGHLPE